MDDKGTLDDEVSIVSGDVCYSFTEFMSAISNHVTRHLEKVRPTSLQIGLLERTQIKFGTPSKLNYACSLYPSGVIHHRTLINEFELVSLLRTFHQIMPH